MLDAEQPALLSESEPPAVAGGAVGLALGCPQETLSDPTTGNYEEDEGLGK